MQKTGVVPVFFCVSGIRKTQLKDIDLSGFAQWIVMKIPPLFLWGIVMDSQVPLFAACAQKYRQNSAVVKPGKDTL